MALPKIDVPIYTVELASTGKPIKFRPFTVKEEKLFLMTNESEDVNAVLTTIKQVLNNCILDDIDIETLPMFDIEHIFMSIRGKSIGEVVSMKYKCNNTVTTDEGEEKICGHLVDVELNITDIKPTPGEGHDKKIVITEKLGMVMKYPSLKLFDSITLNNEDVSMDLLVSCIDFIYDEDNIYYAKDTTKEELIEFVESMQAKDLEKVQNFFETMPKMKKTFHFACKKCGYQEDISIEGIESFFE